MNRDLTVGEPGKVLIKFCLPLFGSMIFQQLYNIADSFVAGKFIGENALSAVGNSYEITLIFLAFAFGLNIGCSVVVSRFFGARKREELKTAVFTTFILTAIALAVLMTIGFVFCRAILRAIHTPDSILADSSLYLYIYIGGLPFVFFYNISTGIFSALGDSLTPFWFLALSSVSNIALDILFVTVFRLGVAGVAWATFLCQGVSCVLAVAFVLVRLKKMNIGKVKPFSFEILKRILVIAFPSFLQQSFISVGNIVIQGVVNRFGESVIAGYAGATKLNNFLVGSVFTMGNGMSNYTAQNIGAQKEFRLRKGFCSGFLLALVITCAFGLMYFFAGEYLLLLFLDDKTGEAMAVGVRFLRFVAPAYFLVATKIMSDGILRGAGKMGLFAFSTFTDLILRVVGAILLSSVLFTDGIWLSWPIGWVVGAGLSLVFCLVFLRKRRLSGENKNVRNGQDAV